VVRPFTIVWMALLDCGIRKSKTIVSSIAVVAGSIEGTTFIRRTGEWIK
jgi:hypothetical protein